MVNSLHNQLEALGLNVGDVVLVHSSFKSLGISDPEEIIGALLTVLGTNDAWLSPIDRYRRTSTIRLGLPPASVFFRSISGSVVARRSRGRLLIRCRTAYRPGSKCPMSSYPFGTSSRMHSDHA